MKKYRYLNFSAYLCFFFTLLNFNIGAQNLDSIYHVLSKTPALSIKRGEVLLNLATIFKEKNPNLAIQYAQELIDIGIHQKHDRFIFEGKMVVGVENIKKDDYYSALLHFQEAKEIATKYNDLEWKKNLIRVSINITGVYWYINDAEKGLDIARKNVKIIKSINDSVYLSDCYHSMGLIFDKDKNIDSSKHYLTLAENIYSKLGNNEKLKSIRYNFSKLYIEIGKTEVAKEILTLLYAQSLKDNDSVMLKLCIPDLAEIYLKEGKIDTALKYAILGEKLLSSDKYASAQVLKLNEVLYEVFIKKNNPQKAILYLQKILEIKEARLIEEKKVKINELEVSFKIKEKEKENKILVENNQQAKNRVLLLIAISAILFALIMIILFIYFRLKSSKLLLETLQLKSLEVNIKLNELINEKKHIINLIIHDIRTPLNIIQLNNKILQHNAGMENNGFKYIEEATDQIYEAIIKIQETENKTLDQTYFDFSVVDLRHMINLTINDFEAYGKSKDISILFKMPTESYFANADSFLLRHVLSNLISNAIKFSDNHTHIEIGIRSNNDEIQIDIKDQGDGLDPAIFESIYTDIELGVNSERSQNSWGKGLKLALMFVRKMEGDISMMSTKGQGTIFTIHLPKYLK